MSIFNWTSTCRFGTISINIWLSKLNLIYIRVIVLTDIKYDIAFIFLITHGFLSVLIAQYFVEALEYIAFLPKHLIGWFTVLNAWLPWLGWILLSHLIWRLVNILRIQLLLGNGGVICYFVIISIFMCRSTFAISRLLFNIWIWSLSIILSFRIGIYKRITFNIIDTFEDWTAVLSIRFDSLIVSKNCLKLYWSIKWNHIRLKYLNSYWIFVISHQFFVDSDVC